MTTSREPGLLKTLLKELFQRRKWQQHFDQHRIFLEWEDMVGAELAARARPRAIRSAVLWLEVADSIWMQQLHLEKRMLLALINRRLEGQELQDIRFRLETRLAVPLPQAPGDEGHPGIKEVSAADRSRFEELIRPLRDEELKATLQRLWLKSRSRVKNP